MTIYRLCDRQYKNDFSGSGAERLGGRWNSRGLKALYAAEHISLAMLEIVVNLPGRQWTGPALFQLIEWELTPSQICSLDTRQLKKNWIQDQAYTRFIGDEFLKSARHLAMKVPSAVIPEEYNVLLNPLHPKFRQLKPTHSRAYKPDPRLIPAGRMEQ